MFTPCKCGVKFDPPTLVLYYKVNPSGKIRKRSMPLRKLGKDSIISEVVKDLKENSKHAKYLENISATQLESLLTRIQNNMEGIDTLPFLKPSTKNTDHNEDLNRLDDFELDKRKAVMDKDFEKNRLRPGDDGFVYDKEVDFTEGKMESGWDDEDEYSDPDF